MPQSGRKHGGVDARSRRRAGAEPATVAGRAVPYLLPAELAGGASPSRRRAAGSAAGRGDSKQNHHTLALSAQSTQFRPEAQR